MGTLGSNVNPARIGESVAQTSRAAELERPGASFGRPPPGGRHSHIASTNVPSVHFPAAFGTERGHGVLEDSSDLNFSHRVGVRFWCSGAACSVMRGPRRVEFLRSAELWPGAAITTQEVENRVSERRYGLTLSAAAAACVH